MELEMMVSAALANGLAYDSPEIKKALDEAYGEGWELDNDTEAE